MNLELWGGMGMGALYCPGGGRGGGDEIGLDLF